MRDSLSLFGAIPAPGRVVRDGNILTGGGVTRPSTAPSANARRTRSTGGVRPEARRPAGTGMH